MHSGREARRKREGECEGGAVTLFPNPLPQALRKVRKQRERRRRMEREDEVEEGRRRRVREGALKEGERVGEGWRGKMRKRWEGEGG